MFSQTRKGLQVIQFYARWKAFFKGFGQMTELSAPQAASIDDAEIAKFSAMAEEWWDVNGKFKPLHRLNPTRIAYIRDKVAAHYNRDISKPYPLKGISIVDIGCGGGLLSEPMARLGASVTGIDASEKNIQISSLHAEQEEITVDYRHTSAESLAAEGAGYDVVLVMEIIEHVADVESFMRAVTQLAKPGALVFVATMNRTLKAYAMAILGAEYILRWLPRGTHDWNKFLRPSEINNLFATNNVQLQELKGVSYTPFTGQWQLSDDISVNYMMMGTKAINR